MKHNLLSETFLVSSAGDMVSVTIETGVADIEFDDDNKEEPHVLVAVTEGKDNADSMLFDRDSATTLAMHLLICAKEAGCPGATRMVNILKQESEFIKIFQKESILN